MISYLELLKLVKDNKEPKKIKLCLSCGERIYKAVYDNEEFNFYELEGKETENFNYYLANTLLESQMIDKLIEVIEEEPKIPEKVIIGKNKPIHRIKKIEKKINEIIDYLKAKEK